MKIQWKTIERDYGYMFGICGRLCGPEHGNLRAGITFTNWLDKNEKEKKRAIRVAKRMIEGWLRVRDSTCVGNGNCLEGNEISGDEFL